MFPLILKRGEGRREGGRGGGEGGEREREAERERNIDWLLPYTPNQGLNSQSRHVPRPEIELATFPCTAGCSNQLSHVAGALIYSTYCLSLFIAK